MKFLSKKILLTLFPTISWKEDSNNRTYCQDGGYGIVSGDCWNGYGHLGLVVIEVSGKMR